MTVGQSACELSWSRCNTVSAGKAAGEPDLFNIERHPAGTLIDQVCDGILGLIGAGLTEGQRLPSVRKLAASVNVSLSTVSLAYERLVSQRLVVARPGAGFFVAYAVRPFPAASSRIRPRIQPTDAVGFVRNAIDLGTHAVPASSGFFPKSWMDSALPASVVGRILKGGVSFAVPAPAQGLVELREQLSIRLRSVGIAASPGQIVTCFGVTHAVQLICRYLVQPGDGVVIEDPSYMVQQAQLCDAGAKLLLVPRRSDGPDLAILEQIVRDHRPRLMFTQTVLHNPTGSTATAANCHGLLLLAEKYDFHIVEDDVFGDVSAVPVLRLAALDNFRRVLYVGSFTKVLSPALRVGFVVAPAEHVDALIDLKILNVLTGSSLQELLVAMVLKSGRYQAHVDSLRRRLAKSRSVGRKALSEVGVRFDNAEMDGLFLWGALPDSVNVDSLLDAAFSEGILLTKGTLFSPSAGFGQYIRFNVAHAADPQLLAFLRHHLQPPAGSLAPTCGEPSLDGFATQGVDY